jgi:hypothetical protein
MLALRKDALAHGTTSPRERLSFSNDHSSRDDHPPTSSERAIERRIAAPPSIGRVIRN